MKEVKDAVQEVSQSAISLGGAVIGPECVKDAATKVSKSAFNLGGAFVTTVPKIFTRLFYTLCHERDQVSDHAILSPFAL